MCSFLLNPKCSQPGLEAFMSPSMGGPPPRPLVAQLQREPGCQNLRASPGLSTELAHSRCMSVECVNQVQPDFRLTQLCSLLLLG